MKAVVQRVSSAKVTCGDYESSIQKGYVVLLGVDIDDKETDLSYIHKKLLALRVFDDQQGKMNLSIQAVKGEILLISQFTLLGSVKGNNRPSFTRSAKPEIAESFYSQLYAMLNAEIPTKKGVFGGNMDLEIHNQGPVTIIIDSKE